MIKDIRTFSDLALACSQQQKTIYEIFEEREANLQEISVEQVRLKVKKSLDAMKEAIEKGLVTKEKSISRQCGTDCVTLKERYKNKPAIFGKTFEKITNFLKSNEIYDVYYSVSGNISC